MKEETRGERDGENARGIRFVSGTGSLASAEMVGCYESKDNCTLSIEALNEDRDYADGMYKLRSDGTGACEWTGIGVTKKTYIDGGVASDFARGFAGMRWVFGPAGGQVDVTIFEPDGSIRLKELLHAQLT